MTYSEVRKKLLGNIEKHSSLGCFPSLQSARSAAYDLLLEMAKESKENFLELQKLLMKHHRPGNSRLQGKFTL